MVLKKEYNLFFFFLSISIYFFDIFSAKIYSLEIPLHWIASLIFIGLALLNFNKFNYLTNLQKKILYFLTIFFFYKYIVTLFNFDLQISFSDTVFKNVYIYLLSRLLKDLSYLSIIYFIFIYALEKNFIKKIFFCALSIISISIIYEFLLYFNLYDFSDILRQVGKNNVTGIGSRNFSSPSFNPEGIIHYNPAFRLVGIFREPTYFSNFIIYASILFLISFSKINFYKKFIIVLFFSIILLLTNSFISIFFSLIFVFSYIIEKNVNISFSGKNLIKLIFLLFIVIIIDIFLINFYLNFSYTESLLAKFLGFTNHLFGFLNLKLFFPQSLMAILDEMTDTFFRVNPEVLRQTSEYTYNFDPSVSFARRPHFDFLVFFQNLYEEENLFIKIFGGGILLEPYYFYITYSRVDTSLYGLNLIFTYGITLIIFFIIFINIIYKSLNYGQNRLLYALFIFNLILLFLSFSILPLELIIILAIIINICEKKIHLHS